MSDGARCHYCRKVPCICAEPTKISSAEELQALQAAQEWQRSIRGLIVALIAENPDFDHEWGGDRNGWGFNFEWIKWVLLRAKNAEAQVKALEADRARLDWLEREATSVFVKGGEEVWCLDEDNSDFAIRESIDAAIQQAQTKEKQTL